MSAAEPLPGPERDPAERRGGAMPYVSYWALLRRQTRREVFALRERGLGVAAIAAELGVDRHEVEAILLSDRRSRSR